jgi:signal transduction histidine kinase
VIEEIAVNGIGITIPSATNPPAAITQLPSDLRSLDIQSTALDFSEPEKVRFRHRLDGSDPDWVETGDQRSVHYGHLPYGTYKFRVQAGTAASGWDPREADFQFLVPTPLWRTGWAIAFYVLVTMGVVASVVRVVSNRRLQQRLEILGQQQAMERERMRIAQDMHDEIGSKLTKISFMSERAKNELQGQESVAKKLNSIAGTSRDLLQSLDEIVWAVNPHNDTLEHLAAYLGHYATEYLQNTSVECELHIPQGLPHHPLSAEFRHNLFLSFEEALNNALKHGRPSRIAVNMRLLPALFEIEVEDNGRGFDPDTIASSTPTPVSGEKRVGYGLRNLRQRLADLGGNCEISSRPGGGCKVTLSVPLKAPKN